MASETQPLLALEGVSVHYGSLDVLENLDFAIRAGEIHAIVGERGAGKSSLARTLAGAIKPKCGRILWKGSTVSPYDRDIASGLGVEFVAQDNGIFSNQTVAFNLLVNRKNIFAGIGFRPHRIIDEAARYLKRMGVGLDASVPVQSLALSDRVLVEILRALYSDPILLILDEALEKLSGSSLALVEPLLKGIAAKGGAVLMITHRIDDIYDFADRVTILRSGEVLVTDKASNVDKVSLIKLAYTQILSRPSAADVNSEFYHFLKYNEAILEHLPVSLVIVDRNAKIKLRNRRAQEFFALKVPSRTEAYVEEGLESLFPPGNEESLSQTRVIVEGHSFDCVYGMKLKLEDQDKVIDLTFDPILDGDHYIGGMLIFNDMTEREALRERMILSEKLAAIGLLSAGVAHEINNPLETICNSVDYLKIRMGDERTIKALVRIEEEASSIGHIVSNLIAFSGNQREKVERLDLGAMLEEISSLLRHNTSFAGTEILYRPPSENLYISASRTEIRQVFLNLIKNGAEAMPEGGLITLSIARETRDGRNWVAASVEDEGPGLDAEARKRMFLPFFSTKSGADGHMGLGLSIVYGIISKLEGSIEAGNAESGGTRFLIRLPACD
jgi:signal transduction histidine kinase